MTDNTELASLMARVAAQDRAAFAALYKALEKPVYRFIQSKLNDPHQSSDILHDVFIDLWRSASRFEGRSTVKTWVFGIAYRKTMDHFRKHSRTDLTNEMEETVDDTPDAVTCIAAAQEAVHLRFCMETLKPQHRSAVELAFYEDMSYGQIAETAEVPEGTIKTRIFHAKKLLLRCLEARMKEART